MIMAEFEGQIEFLSLGGMADGEINGEILDQIVTAFPRLRYLCILIGWDIATWEIQCVSLLVRCQKFWLTSDHSQPLRKRLGN